ncbi:type II secretion system protein [Parashewanella curva]|uniref:Type II secretion system protein n=1 Tax=Parashewanella curva TaxID=2338552 RepID=A0A3L8PX66_9GAMM|nr:type II secretion system protein [Parashewanella curva]RLV59038.1 type II secretion system protein [Parashewanella curva]
MKQVSRIPKFHVSKKGFTLVELIATMVLIGILAVSVAPKFFGPSSYNAYALRAELISYLRNIQLRAMNNTDKCFRFSATSQGYQTLIADRNSNGVCVSNSYSNFFPLSSWPKDVEVTSHLYLPPTTLLFDFSTNGGLVRSNIYNDKITITIRAGDTVKIEILKAGYIHGI